MIRFWITCLLLFGLYSPLLAQNFLEKKIEFHADNIPITDALEQLSAQTGIDIAYSKNYFKNAPPINFHREDVPIRQVLEDILANTLMDYKTLGENRVLLFKAEPVYYQLSGYVRDKETGEALVGARVIPPKNQLGTITNEYGFFSLLVQPGNQTFIIRSIGYKTTDSTFTIKKDRSINIGLKSIDLAVVEVTGNPDIPLLHPIEQNRDNITVLSPALLKRIPTLNGQADFQRIAQNLPGISSNNDGLGGLRVRGGESGQNMLYIDGSPVYIPYHLLGLYTTYNPETVKSIQVVKGNFPARYGHAVSSILDVRIREGNRKKWQGAANIDLLSAGLSVEGPLGKKGSMLIAGRFSPTAYFFEPVLDRLYFGSQSDQLTTNFHDFNIKLNWEPTEKDRFFLSVFSGYDQIDQLGLSQSSDGISASFSEFLLNWQNTVGSFRWNHLFSDKLFLNTTVYYSSYRHKFSSRTDFEIATPDTYVLDQFIIDNRSDNTEIGARYDLNYAFNKKNNLRFGGEYNYRLLSPRFYSLYELIFDSELEDEFGGNYDFSYLYQEITQPSYDMHQAAFYIEDHMRLNRWYFNLGIRFSFLQNVATVNSESIESSMIQPEPRILIKYRINEKMTLSTTFNRRAQYLHLIANPAIQMPNNIWLPATYSRLPQILYEGELDFRYEVNKKLELGATGFYRQTENMYAFADSVVFFAPSESFASFDYLTKGTGYNQGIEILIDYADKKRGLLMAYTLSKSERQFEAINLGNRYADAFDSRHQISLAFHQQITKRFSFGLNWLYASKRPQFNLFEATAGGSLSEIHADPIGQLHTTRLYGYNRLDVDLRYEVKGKKVAQQIRLGVYNMLNTRNVAFNTIDYQDPITGAISSSPLYSIPIMPSFSYRISF